MSMSVLKPCEVLLASQVILQLTRVETRTLQLMNICKVRRDVRHIAPMKKAASSLISLE